MKNAAKITTAGALAYIIFNRSGGGGGGGWGLPYYHIEKIKVILEPPKQPIFFEMDDFLKNEKIKKLTKVTSN